MEGVKHYLQDIDHAVGCIEIVLEDLRNGLKGIQDELAKIDDDDEVKTIADVGEVAGAIAEWFLLDQRQVEELGKYYQRLFGNLFTLQQYAIGRKDAFKRDDATEVATQDADASGNT